MAVVSMKSLLEAGVHFGHQTRRWNPKMAPYIYTERNGIYIIDLQKTVKKIEEAYNFIRDLAANGENVLFVGTKKQAQDAIREEAERVDQYYVNARWLGGMMTNFKTMRTRIDRLAQLRKMQEDGTFAMLPKKEVIKLEGEIAKLEKYLGGDAAGLLGGLRKTLLAEPLDGLVHVAVSLNESLLAVHHADIGHFAQGFYISSSECHSLFPPVYYSAAFSASAAGASLLASP